MPLKAFCEELKRDVLYNEFLFCEIPKTGHYKCPFCNCVMIPVNGKVAVHHFRHKVKCPYATEPETERHIKMKEWFLKNINDAEVEKRIGNSIADIYCGLSRFVIECQCSSITASDLIRRSSKYHSMGLDVFWVFPLERRHRMRLANPRIVEKMCGLAYNGNCFYLDIEKGKLVKGIWKKTFFQNENRWFFNSKRNRQMVIYPCSLYVDFPLVRYNKSALEDERYG